jgi:hypothetical protein
MRLLVIVKHPASAFSKFVPPLPWSLQNPRWEHVNFARTDELLKSGKINENRGRNQFSLNNETS